MTKGHSDRGGIRGLRRQPVVLSLIIGVPQAHSYVIAKKSQGGRNGGFWKNRSKRGPKDGISKGNDSFWTSDRFGQKPSFPPPGIDERSHSGRTDLLYVKR